MQLRKMLTSLLCWGDWFEVALAVAVFAFGITLYKDGKREIYDGFVLAFSMVPLLLLFLKRRLAEGRAQRGLAVLIPLILLFDIVVIIAATAFVAGLGIMIEDMFQAIFGVDKPQHHMNVADVWLLIGLLYALYVLAKLAVWVKQKERVKKQC